MEILEPSAVAQPRLDEFARIRRFFAPLAGPGGLQLRDDAALIEPPAGQDLVLTADAIVAGIHYLADDPPELIARKLLRVNLSDLAAKGATPLSYLMTLALPPECDEDWLQSFSAGLAADQAEFGIVLLGGDSVATPGPATFSVTAIGATPAGKIIRRAGARPGDTIYVSGTIGDAALGLAVLTGREGSLGAEDEAFLADRYHLPRPRLCLGQRLRGLASAMLDISDGLAADCAHLCAASDVAAQIEAEAVPLSDAARRALAEDAGLRALILGGGDDYELLFTSSPDNAPAIEAISRELGLELTPIGRIVAGEGLSIRDGSGRSIELGTAGYRHF